MIVSTLCDYVFTLLHMYWAMYLANKISRTIQVFVSTKILQHLVLQFAPLNKMMIKAN